MKLSRMAFVLVSVASVTAAGVAAVACSSSTTPVTPPANNDSGMMAAMDSSMTAMDSTMTATDTGMMMMTGDTSMPATDAGCGNSPALHTGTAGGGLFCPFGVGPDGGDLTLYCGADGGTANVCCIGGEDLDSGTFPPSVCSANACTFTATTGNTQIQCEDPGTDCPAGNVCCGAASKMHVVGPKAGCTYDSLTDWVYTKCEMGTACAATAAAPGTGAEFQVCASSTECTGGKTCTPFKAKGIDLGFCM